MTTGFLLALLLPQANGLWRSAMPEGPLVALVAGTLLLAVRARERPTVGRAAALGAALGLGLLVKQTFAIYAAIPALLAARALGLRALVTAFVAGLIAGPWYLGHAEQQLAYAAASAPGRVEAGLALHLAFYPVVAAIEGLGPPLLLALLAVRRRALGLAAVAGLGGLLMLVAIPKKYPRLLAPLTPLAAVLAGASLPPAAAGLAVAAGAGWLLLASSRTIPLPAAIEALAGGCPQRWLRGPLREDLGFEAVEAAVRAAPPGAVIVVDPPEIPCEIASTFPWLDHLGPWLRRAGLDRELRVAERDGDLPEAALIVDWTGGPGQAVAVAPLGRVFTVRVGQP